MSTKNHMYKLFFKRSIDLVVSIFVFIVTSPILIITAILLAIYNKGSIFFVQERPGRFEKIFKLVKFKTMRDAFDQLGRPLPDYQRITPIGSFVRRTSLDELPQLINVIKGDMSLVGPRPLLLRYLPLYSEFQKKRHDVKPGITGWAQVNGRNAISWQRKFELDVYYVENCSCLLDIKILFITFIKVMKRSDINAINAATMPPFNGKN
jgi:lipopolysaccharide/colanic/teichoic acid biosynthesis glycosyltransferase